RHDCRSGRHFLLHGDDPAMDARPVWRDVTGGALVGYSAYLCRDLWRAAGLCGDHPAQPGHACAQPQGPTAGGACALPQPEGGLTTGLTPSVRIRPAPWCRSRLSNPTSLATGRVFLLESRACLAAPQTTLGVAFIQ